MTEEKTSELKADANIVESEPKKKRSKFKLLTKIAGILLIIGIIGIIVLSLTYDTIVSKTVATVGSHLTGTEVKLETFSISLFKGKVTIGGFSVANPKGYKTTHAIKVGELSIDLDISSLLSDEIIVEEIKLSGLAISYEQGLSGNNLFDIKNHLAKMSESEKQAEEKQETQTEEAPEVKEKPGKKVKVTVIHFTDGEITVAAKSDFIPVVTLPMANTSLRPAKAMSWAELGSTMWDGLYASVANTVTSSANIIGNGGKKAFDESKKAGGKLIDGVKSLF
jgi:hypothetical protein